jgi:hypothetical protein
MPQVHGHFIYYPGSITRLVHRLAANGIHSRQQLLDKYDVDTRSYEAIKGVGPVLSELLVWLRGSTIDKWRELTGLPAFDDPDLEAGSKTGG